MTMSLVVELIGRPNKSVVVVNGRTDGTMDGRTLARTDRRTRPFSFWVCTLEGVSSGYNG